MSKVVKDDKHGLTHTRTTSALNASRFKGHNPNYTIDSSQFVSHYIEPEIVVDNLTEMDGK